MSLFDAVKVASFAVDEIQRRPRPVGGPFYKDRSIYSILTSTTSELGELAEEVMIQQGNSYKQPGHDGIIGEAIDTIACLLDLIHTYDPTITENDLRAIAKLKCDKWVSSVAKHRGF